MFEWTTIDWATAAPAIGAAFVASTVEVVEAFTIVLAVASLRGWRPALTGAGAALLALAAVVAALGPALSLVPLRALQAVIGILLLLFGLGWLRKAVLRGAGLMALHDEDAIHHRERARIDEEMRAGRAADWIAGLASFKAVLLEGLEVVFIVLAVGAGRGLMIPASIGALAAFAAVMAAGLLIRKPLSQVPENTLKFAVGVMLSAFGVFWTTEALGAEWPGGDFALFGLAAVFLLAALGLVALVRPKPGSSAGMNVVIEVLEELWSMFAGDRRLTLLVLVVVAAAAAVALLLPGLRGFAPPLLLLGALAVLADSVFQAARKARRKP